LYDVPSFPFPLPSVAAFSNDHEPTRPGDQIPPASAREARRQRAIRDFTAAP
jgi:hypothetical protein